MKIDGQVTGDGPIDGNKSLILIPLVDKRLSAVTISAVAALTVRFTSELSIK